MSLGEPETSEMRGFYKLLGNSKYGKMEEGLNELGLYLRCGAMIEEEVVVAPSIIKVSTRPHKRL